MYDKMYLFPSVSQLLVQGGSAPSIDQVNKNEY